VLLTILAMTLADPLYCADGCGQSDVAGSHQGASGSSVDCAFCQTAALPVAPLSVAPAIAQTRMPDLLAAPCVTPPAANLEHPPRA
jgi:hypothetical protein